MSDAKVHIVTCLNAECEIEYAGMCEDLETRGVGCVMEGRGDYGIGSTFMEKFKEMVEKTLVTIIHLCPDMISRLTDLTDVLQGHQSQKYLFIHVRSTPKEIPVVFKEATKMFLVNDSYYKKIIDKILVIVHQPICASSATELTDPSDAELSSATIEDDDCLYSDTGISPYSNPPLTERDEFVSHVEDEQCRDTGVYFLSGKIQYKPHHLLKWSTPAELREMCRKRTLYDRSNRSNTVRCLLTKVLPEIFAKKNIPAIAELLAVPVSVIQNKVLTKLRDILLSTKPEDIDRPDLKTAEKALFECCLTNTDFIDPVFVPNLTITYLLTLVYLAVFQDSRHSSLDTTIKRVKQFISQKNPGNINPFGDIRSFVDDIRKRIDDIVKAVTAIGTNRKHLSPVKKKSWPVHFSMVLGTLLEVFHGDPQTALEALDTLPLLLKPAKPKVRNVLQKPKLNQRVIQMVTSGMVAYLNALGDTVGEDIEDRAKSAFTALGLSLKSLDRSMYNMARCLLFSQSPVVRQGAMTLWKDVNDETTDSLMMTEVLKHLQPISTNHLHKQPTNHSTSSASWKVASTGLGSEKVMFHINLPSEDVLVKHNKSPFKSSDCGHLTSVEVLRDLSTHPHILSMWAYRIDQFPVFYITEDYSQQNFQKVLYYSAKSKAWFKPLELMQFLLQALDAVIALHEHGYIHRDLTASSFAYDKQCKSIKLCRFMLARKCGREATVVDRECSSIPMRWSAPESLKQHHFSMRSDYWMVGHLIYEVTTHGCLPYSDLGLQNESAIETMIKENRKKLYQERCIPTTVFDVIQSCTRFDDTHRMSVCEAKSRLEETYDRYVSSDDLPEQISSVTPDVLFPRPDRTSFQVLPKEDSERDDGYDVAVHDYQNFEDSQRYLSEEEPLYEELGPREDVFFLLKPNQRMDVLRRRLTHTEESQLNTESIPGIYGQVTVENRNQTEYLVYNFPTGHCVSLSNAVDVRSFGLWSVEYIRCLSVVAKTLSLLHQRSWVHGSLSADNIWISEAEDKGDYKVYFSDLGYIRRSCNTEDGVIADESFVVPQDELVYRRSPPEVIRDGTYSWASDVFSFGLILWNGFFNFSSYHNLKDLNTLESIPKDKLYEYLTTTSGNKILPKPAKCPDSIYSLMLLCWSPERHERPQMTIVQQKLLESISDEGCPRQDRDQYEYVDAEGQSSEDDPYDYPDRDSRETKIHTNVAVSSLENDRLPLSFPPSTHEGGSTAALRQKKLERQNPKTSQGLETKRSGDYDEVEECSLQHDGSRSSFFSSSVGRCSSLQEDAKMQKTSQVSFTKPGHNSEPLLGNEKEGKGIHLQTFLTGSATRQNATQGTACNQIPRIGKSTHVSQSNLESLPQDSISVYSEATQYEMFKDPTYVVKKPNRNEKPPLPPKPKHMLRNTQVASSSDDQPYGCDDIYMDPESSVHTSNEGPSRNRPGSQQPSNQTELHTVHTVSHRVTNANRPPSPQSPPPPPQRPPPRRKSDNSNS
ncbi:uncharacterized protein [Haliotis asinina]|uniref:uncharacterized protein isoform X2 n=1 Tax=Haliotis asinina TaxID=109174 RepID=UPI0035319041